MFLAAKSAVHIKCSLEKKRKADLLSTRILIGYRGQIYEDA
jgi:hypothetical protein